VRIPRLGVRTRLLLAIVAAVAVALAIGVAAFNVLLQQQLASSAQDLARAEAVAELSSVRVEHGSLLAPAGPDQGRIASQVWVFARSTALEAPRVPKQIDTAARSLAGGPERSLRVGEDVRMHAVPIVQDGTRYGTVVAAVSLDAYQQTERAALVGSIVLATVLLAAMAAIAWWMLGRALRPVARMTESAATWSEQDLDQRFDLGEPYDELTRLAATLDGLLERIAASLRHEQRLTAELSHELRTPLARLKGETELMLRRGRTTAEYVAALRAIDRNLDEMTRTVEMLMSAARHEAGLTTTTSDLRDAVQSAVDAVRETSSGPRVRIALPADPVRVLVEPELLARIVQPLLDNACRYGRSAVRVEVLRNGAVATVEIEDDGPGVRDEELESIFDPGSRGSAAGTSSSGAGLGLALARRLARSAGGDVVAEPSAAGGRFSVTLPVGR
jgi:signal transduction histidine kinase